MNLPNELLLIISSYLSLREVASLALTCTRAFAILTNVTYTQRLVQEDAIPLNEDLMRGLQRLARSYFYCLYQNNIAQPITEVRDIGFYRVNHLQYEIMIDVYEQPLILYGDRWMELKSETIKEMQVVIIRDPPDGCTDEHLIMLDYQGGIIIDNGTFIVGARKLLETNYSGIAFLDDHDRCRYLTFEGRLEDLIYLPPGKEVGVTYSEHSPTEYALAYFLDLQGQLYVDVCDISSLDMSLDITLYQPCQTQVHSMVHYRKEEYYFLNLNKDLIYVSKISKKQRYTKKKCLLEAIDDVSVYDNRLCVLKQGTVYYTYAFAGLELEPVIAGLPTPVTRVRIGRGDVHRTNIIEIW